MMSVFTVAFLAGTPHSRSCFTSLNNPNIVHILNDLFPVLLKQFGHQFNTQIQVSHPLSKLENDIN